MRLDKFINTVNLTKRRAIAQDMIKHNAIFVNGSLAKASKDVKILDIVEFRLFDTTEKYQVLKLPTTKSIPKQAQDEYVKKL